MVQSAEVVGIGTGSTVDTLVDYLRTVRDYIKHVVFVPSSSSTLIKLKEAGLRVTAPEAVESMDLYVDSADEVDPQLNMLKGGGAAMTMEKILAFYSKKRVFIVDFAKLVSRLGEKHPLPVEVVPRAVSMVLSRLRQLGFKVSLRVSRGGKYGPVVTDTGGMVVDVEIPPGVDLAKLEALLKSLPGVVETGLFLGYADLVVVGYTDRVEVRRRV